MSKPSIHSEIGTGRYEPEGIYLSRPFQGPSKLVRRWGDNPAHYQQITIGGAALKGHNGIDFALPAETPILAADSGHVIEIGNDPQGYGRFIRIEHRWGESLYAHLSGFAVDAGQRIGRQQQLALLERPAAENDENTLRPHLHFSIRIFPYDRSDGWGGYSDPSPYLLELDDTD